MRPAWRAALASCGLLVVAACGPNGCEPLPWGPPQADAPPVPPAPAEAPAATSPAGPSQAAPAGPVLVDLRDVDASIRVDMRYASRNNFLRETLYPANRCLLRPETADRLRRVQEHLAAAGLGLQVWDCYRPLSIQRRMWEYMPDPRYVADPQEGSKHNRGAAVDVTLVRLGGEAVDMGTDHDDFSERAGRDYSDFPFEVIRNRKVLENAMTLQGFLPLPSEWWHFDDPAWQRFDVLDEPLDPAR